MNFFASASAAERYARARPFFHPLAVSRILERTGRVGAALDVACGTGMGAKALLAIADRVTGCDLSTEMLEYAKRDVPTAQFVHSSAEELPFDDSSLELVTTFLAFHWFDQARFLREVKRVLEPRGWLVICNHWFQGNLVGHPEFDAFRQAFYERFPTPKRSTSGLEPEAATRYGFEFVTRVDFEHTVPMTAEELSWYISSQSNVIARVEGGEAKLETVLTEIRNAVTPMLGEARGEFGFGGSLWFLRSS
jgi:ubiquinone/menaquinone biosynthesis C-methylase UbiE